MGSGEQSRDCRRRFRVGVRQPGMHRRKGGLGAEPGKKKSKESLSQKGSMEPAAEARSLKKSLPSDPVPTDSRIIPVKANAIPIEHIKRYFHTASSEVDVAPK